MDKSEKSILVIDDDMMVTYALSNLLGREGYSATTSQDGNTVLDKIIKENNFDAIVCDLRLPGMNGVEIVRGIKAYLKANNKPEVPVIFITGYADSELNTEAEKLGKLILKPFDNRDLLDSIEELID